MSSVKYPWHSVNDFLHSQQWQYFDSDLRGDDFYLSDPDRAKRCDEASEYGTDGSTHAEIIEDWRAFLSNLKIFDPEFDDIEDIAEYDITQAQYDAISADIDRCEQWHIEHKTIDQQLS